MEIKELIQAPQLFIVYAITILYTITFSLAAVVTQPIANVAESPQGIHQTAKMETDGLNQLQGVRNNS